MTEVKKKWFGISIISILICVVLFVVLVFSNLLWINNVDSLTKDKISLQNEIDQKDAEISYLSLNLGKLERLKNVTSEVRFPPYDYYNGKWYGEWQPVAAFSGTDDMVTEAFLISSPYDLWRLDWTATPHSEGSSIGINVYTASQPKYCIVNLAPSGEHLDYAWYIPWTSVTSTEFYIEITCAGISTWSIIVEELDYV